jgi:hypothetical protein
VIELGFVIKGYPGSGRRIEDDSDLAHVSRPDLIQGAFMGDAIFRLPGSDFSTHFGWVTLLDWCLRLTVATRDLESSGSGRFEFAESDDFVEFESGAAGVAVACSYKSETAVAQFSDLKSAVDEFVDDRLRWVAQEFPGAMRNASMPDVFFRLGRSLPPDFADGVAEP